MKPLSIYIILLFSALLGCSQNKKYNGNFESLDSTSKPKGWFFSKSDKKEYLFSIDSLVKNEGKYSLSISNLSENSSFGAATYMIPKTFVGKEIVLKGFIKTQNVTDGFSGLWLRVDGLEGVLEFDNMANQGIKGTTDWTEYTIKLPYDNKKADKIFFGGLLTGKGKIWLDDLRLYIDGKPIDDATTSSIKKSKAQMDTTFSTRSKVDTIALNKQRITNLSLLCQVWGFLKYFHPSVTNGDYNFDAELFRIMPHVIKAPNNGALSDTIEHWVDKFGQPKLCGGCRPDTSNRLAYKPDYGSIFNTTIFKLSLVNKLLYILKNHNSADNYYVDMAYGVRNPLFKHEAAYENLIYPDAGYRLLTLFRYWNMIQYFYPYKHLIGSDWDNILIEFIPRFTTASNKTEYILTTLALITKLNDTHANIWSFNQALENYKGDYTFPFQAKFIENKLTITGYYVDTLEVIKKLKIGDVINHIDNISVDKLIKKYLPITAASNYPTQLRDMPGRYLLRSNKRNIDLQILRDGKTLTISMNTIELAKVNKLSDNDPDPKAPGYKLLSEKIGYLFPGKYKNQDLPKIEKLFADTKGIIVDLRCYPSDFMFYTFVPYIKTGNSDFAKFVIGTIQHPGLFKIGPSVSVMGQNEYKGKIVVIVNEQTQSQAEYTTMAFQSSKNVTVIGSTTAGADGDVSTIMLPGGIKTMISGIGVLYPDGSETQRKGVKIDYEIRPTIKGIADGKDELLEKAKEIIMRGN